MTQPKDNGWEKWGNHVLNRLESNDKAHEKISDQLQTLHVDIAGLNVKSGIWGAIGGAMLAIPTMIVGWFITGK